MVVDDNLALVTTRCQTAGYYMFISDWKDPASSLAVSNQASCQALQWLPRT